jgi:hypothetical protein
LNITCSQENSKIIIVGIAPITGKSELFRLSANLGKMGRMGRGVEKHKNIKESFFNER